MPPPSGTRPTAPRGRRSPSIARVDLDRDVTAPGSMALTAHGLAGRDVDLACVHRVDARLLRACHRVVARGDARSVGAAAACGQHRRRPTLAPGVVEDDNVPAPDARRGLDRRRGIERAAAPMARRHRARPGDRRIAPRASRRSPRLSRSRRRRGASIVGRIGVARQRDRRGHRARVRGISDHRAVEHHVRRGAAAASFQHERRARRPRATAEPTRRSRAPCAAAIARPPSVTVSISVRDRRIVGRERARAIRERHRARQLALGDRAASPP